MSNGDIHFVQGALLGWLGATLVVSIGGASGVYIAAIAALVGGTPALIWHWRR